MSAVEREISDALNEDFRRLVESNPSLRRLFEVREPRYRYWQHAGWMYCWTTERVNGKFVAMAYRPEGKGSRTGKASQWRMVKEVSFVNRNKAKARARQWYEAAKAKATE